MWKLLFCSGLLLASASPAIADSTLLTATASTNFLIGCPESSREQPITENNACLRGILPTAKQTALDSAKKEARRLCRDRSGKEPWVALDAWILNFHSEPKCVFFYEERPETLGMKFRCDAWYTVQCEVPDQKAASQSIAKRTEDRVVADDAFSFPAGAAISP